MSNRGQGMTEDFQGIIKGSLEIASRNWLTVKQLHLFPADYPAFWPALKKNTIVLLINLDPVTGERGFSMERLNHAHIPPLLLSIFFIIGDQALLLPG